MEMERGGEGRGRGERIDREGERSYRLIYGYVIINNLLIGAN